MKALRNWLNAECTIVRPTMGEDGEMEHATNGGVLLTIVGGLAMIAGLGILNAMLP